MKWGHDEYNQPIEEDLKLLKEVAEWVGIRAMSLRAGAELLSLQGSRPISYEGLRLILKEGKHFA